MPKTLEKQNRRVCILTTVHIPFDTRIFYKEAKTLASAGYDVILIAQHAREEIKEGIFIIPLPISKNRIDRMTRVTLKALYLALRQKAAVYHFHDPELLPVGIFLKICGKCVVYDVHEHVAQDILGKHWIRPQLRSIVSRSAGFVEACASRCFDAVIAATSTIAGIFPRTKPILVQNFPILDELLDVETIPYQQRQPVVVYVGAICESRGAKEMIAAFASVQANAKILLAGQITPASLETEMRRAGWEKVEYRGFQQRRDVAKLLGRARAGLVVLHPTQAYLDSQPTKLFEYMSAGIPVIASNFPAWQSLIESVGCGLVVDPLDIKGIAQAIQWIFDHPVEAEAMGRRGRDAIRSTYNWNTQATTLLAAYERVVS